LFKKTIAALALFIVTFAGFASADQVVDRIVAVVNGEIITLYELNDRLKPYLAQYQGRQLSPGEKEALMAMRRELLQVMIDEILIRQEAQKYNIEVTDMEIQSRIREIREENSLTEQDLERRLEIQGMTRKEYEQGIKESILKQRLLRYMVGRKVVVTQEEIEGYYRENKDDYVQDRTVDVSFILLAPQTPVDEVVGAIESGEMTFAQAADKYSVGPGAGKGGRLGEMAWRDLAPEWKQALSSLDPGQMSEPFEIQGHTALILLNRVNDGEVRTLDEVEDEIYETLYQPKLESNYAEFVQRLREKALIEVKI